jgi:hypothetical protein
VHFQYFEKELQQQLKAIGALWDPTQKLWYAPESHVRELGLTDRIAK